jgi:tRNA (guanine37-N1)-methyltransferase
MSVKFHVITLFPDMVSHAARTGLVGQAIEQGRLGLHVVSPREFTEDNHQSVDDRPFGGGDGMVMLGEPLARALVKVTGAITDGRRRRVIHLSPRGPKFTDAKARELATQYDDVVLISSRYGGLDQRFINRHVDEELSIGDYILTGGELAALVVIDSVGRLVPGVLGNQTSPERESFALGGDLEHPQFTRPREWGGQAVPDAYLSGDHAKIGLFQRALSILVTLQMRPEIYHIAVPMRPPPDLDANAVREAERIVRDLDEEEFSTLGLRDRELLTERLGELAGRLPPEYKKRK